MFKEKSFNVLLFCIIVTVSSGVLQYMNPGISIFDGGLITAVLLTIFLKNDAYTKLFGGIGAGLIIVSSFYEHEHMERDQVLIQHAFSLMIVLMTMIFVLYVKKLYRSIESEQMQVNALFEHATEGIILTDDKGKIVLLNPAASNLLEYEKDELLGKSIEILIPGRFHAHHTQYREGFYQHPSNRTMGHGRDLFARKKDGREFPVEVSLSYYRQKNTFFVIAFLVDITQRKQAERELLDRKAELEKITQDISRLNAELESKVEQRTLILREALQELERSQGELNEALNKEKELNEIKSRFVSMASHEFRTPLSTVLSSAALLSRYTQTADQEKRDKHIKKIKDSVKHLNDLLEDFLSLGKLEEGIIRAEMTKFPVKEFLDEIVEEMRPLAKPGQDIHCDCPGDHSFVSDKRLLRNILINLLSNASKFSPEGAGIWLNVQHHPGRNMFLSVRDEGIGISPEDQQHLFSTFFRGANAQNIEGTGLGLHIVRRYVDLLGGTLGLESILDKGTTITVEVPEGTVD
ncbi:PAS domain-containing sensor histidine kinase [Flavitalea sp. BT771]|uniref:sensor histidine kinase n=1 Tax=Flavitalea sp. BT771 TaxID=3063329 RepID=UPI0026E3DF10|nr:PAS domain-containing sensor histidine kinase [Flavitalea sp. BT771]MDO6429480.1 PAS domain-containing sensor histidine kinase [Flavitalea sp. BT771]MDV6218392.1 PAS domain-containing sensor histidine kinase [Flavitalea sp. BT771]